MAIANIKNDKLRRASVIGVAIPALILYALYGAAEFIKEFWWRDVIDAWRGYND